VAKETFDSTDDEKRLKNNPEPLKDYTGPDDVSRLYRMLSNDEKKAMGDIKEMSQLLINKIREVCDDNEYRKDAVKHIQMGAMWAIKNLTDVNRGKN